MAEKTLDWYIQDKTLLQKYLELLQKCDNMVEVVEQVVKTMILDDNMRTNVNTVYKSAFFDALKPHLGNLEGGVSFATFNRRCNDMIRTLSKQERHKVVQAVLDGNAKGKIEIDAPNPAEGREGRIRLFLEIPLKDSGKLALSSGAFDLEFKEIIIRGFDASYTDQTVCCYDLQGDIERMANALECLVALLEENFEQSVRVHYIYGNIDRTGLTLQQVILMIRHIKKK